MLVVIGLLAASLVSTPLMVTAAAFAIAGIVYNVRPMRTKDRAYLDVLSESLNNPIRLVLGWTMVDAATLPPSSVVIAYWMGGAFLMAMKRYSEYRRIGNPEAAGAYRRSFRFYTEETLLLSSFFYALLASFLLGVFLVKYRIEYVLALHFFAVLFTWYLAIALRADSAAQAPEKLHRERRFLGFCGLLVAVVAVLTFIELPMLEVLMVPLRY